MPYDQCSIFLVKSNPNPPPTPTPSLEQSNKTKLNDGHKGQEDRVKTNVQSPNESNSKEVADLPKPDSLQKSDKEIVIPMKSKKIEGNVDTAQLLAQFLLNPENYIVLDGDEPTEISGEGEIHHDQSLEDFEKWKELQELREFQIFKQLRDSEDYAEWKEFIEWKAWKEFKEFQAWKLHEKDARVANKK